MTVVGESRRAGLTLSSAIELCRALELQSALLLDNGKDVQVRLKTYPEQEEFWTLRAPSTQDPQKRSKMTSVFCYCLMNEKGIMPKGTSFKLYVF